MPNYTTIELTLDDIAGRSSLNARPERLDDDVNGLAATIAAVGLLQKITLVRVGDEPPAYEVLAGWRRTKALRILAADGRWREPFEAILFEGSHEDAIAASIAENTERRALHPAEEAEAFAMLANTGQTAEEIANHFGATVRHVKARLRLADLCPEAMALWKAGQLTLDTAQALSAGTHDQQRTLLQDRSHSAREAWYIRSRLNSGKVAADDVRARYVGRDAYVAAGGEIDENLFGEFDHFRDEALLDRLVKEKLVTEGEQICAEEGWGFCVLEEDWGPEGRSFRLDRRSDMLDEERGKIESLEHQVSQLEAEDDLDEEAIDKLQREIRQIQARAQLRGIPAAERAVMGISVELGEGAAIEVQRGWIKREDAPAATAPDPAPNDAVDEAPQDAPPKHSKALEGFLAATRSQALREAVRMRPDLALILATAALATFGGRSVHIRATIGGARPDNHLARAVSDCAGFAEAALLLAKAPHANVLTAFADLVSCAVAVGDAGADEIAAVFSLAAQRGSAIREHLLDAFDAPRYFGALSKEACTEAIIEMDGSNACSSKKKAEIADYAAARAAHHKWLPAELKKHCPLIEATAPDPGEARELEQANAAEPSLAEAMSAALDAAEEGECDLQASIGDFVVQRCKVDPALRVKAAVLFDAWKGSREAAGLEACSIQAFGRLVKLLGYKSHRFSEGVHYLGLDLSLQPAEAAV